MSEIVTSLSDAFPPAGAEPYFCFCAVLRIIGKIDDLDEISQTLGLQPKHTHRMGELKSPRRSERWKEDAWLYEPPVDENRPLEEHIMALWDRLRPHVKYLKSLKESHKVDIFCGYRSNSDTAGFEISHECLGLFIELEVPFGLSVIIA